jgi:peptidoglycan/LPS O-acetylase OafA/YrhL
MIDPPVVKPSPIRPFAVNNFDLLRILAATQVLFFHSAQDLQIETPSWASPFLYFPGVPIFFVISGYLVSASYERSDDLWSYLKKRVLRIFPGLWACLALTVIVASAFGFNVLQISGLVWFVAQVAGVIYTPRVLADFGAGSYNGSLWTIPIELQFYCALPLVYAIARPAKSSNFGFFALLVIFTILACVIGWYLPGMGLASESLTEKLVRYSFLPNFFLFLAGVVLQRVGAYRSQLIFGMGFRWVAAYLLFCYLVPESGVSLVVSRLVLAVCVISLAYTLPGVAAKLLHGNDISYGVYIYHGLILNIMISLHLLHEPKYLAVVLVTAYLAGYLSWIGVERRFLRKKRQRLRTDP